MLFCKPNRTTNINLTMIIPQNSPMIEEKGRNSDCKSTFKGLSQKQRKAKENLSITLFDTNKQVYLNLNLPYQKTYQTELNILLALRYMKFQTAFTPMPPALPFLIGGISGAIATFFIQPIDTLKIQIQVISQQIGRQRTQALTIPNILIKVKDNQGLSALYRGLDSAILRQIFYASARIGAYQSSLKYYQEYVNRKSNSMEKIIFSMVSGAFGALVGNPFDVALIRRQASLATNKHHYRNTLQAFHSIVRSEGVFALWRGINITIWRVVVINLGQLAGKDIIAEQLSQVEISKEVRHNLTALLASLLTAAISLPIDNIKVKLQKQDQTCVSYKGILDCLVKSVGRQGILRLWVGLPVYFIRGTPHSFILLRCQQYLSQLWKQAPTK